MVKLTETAAQKIKDLIKEVGNEGGDCLRVSVQGGGCSGFSYSIQLDTKTEEDVAEESHGVMVIVDPLSIKYLDGAEVDYKMDGLMGGFAVNNPKAKTSCGCGSSFSTEDDHKH